MEIIFGVMSIVLVLGLGMFGIYSLFQAGNLLVKVKRHRIDERYEFMVLKALAYTMILILILHLVQLIIGGILGTQWLKSGSYFIPIISAGMPYRSVLDNSPMHIEAIVFDVTVFGIIFRKIKRQYGE